MCEVCEHTIQRVRLQVNADRSDPTRTKTLREAFAREMRARFNELARAIREAIVVKDVFGLKSPMERIFVNLNPGEFAFKTSQQKINEFMKWLDTQVEQGILQTGSQKQVGTALNAAWTDRYVLDSYKRGVMRARYEMNTAGHGVPNIEPQMAMNGPFHIDRVGILYSRVFSELKGITAAMDSQISRVLARGMADGDGPRLLAGKIIKAVTGMGNLDLTDDLGRFIPARRRAEILARTEVIRSHHQAMVQEYKNFGVEGVNVQAEWMTAGDNRVCNQCADMEGSIFTLDQIQNMIPAHPQCRCIALPIMKGG